MGEAKCPLLEIKGQHHLTSPLREGEEGGGPP
jgi:hypothetical protein